MTLALADTHCHIHSIGANSDDFTVQKWRDGGVNSADEVIKLAIGCGVNKFICVGTDLEDSQRAIEFVQKRENCWATIGVHPHEAQKYSDRMDLLQEFCNKWASESKVVAIGEVGLDLFKNYSPKADQIKVLEFFLEVAQQNALPVILHVRDAHEDFWPIFDNIRGLRGVLHSFSATTTELEQGLKRGLYVGLNGIMTFTKDTDQLAVVKNLPLERLLLETDAPYLAPKPHRGEVCQPAHVRDVAEFLAELRGESLEVLVAQTTENACELFNIT